MDQGLPLPRRIWAIVSVSAGSILYTLDASVANVALPSIARALQIDNSQAVLLVSVYNLVLAIVLLPLAALGERLGLKRISTAGLIFYLAAALACYLAPSFTVLLVARACQAVAAAAVLSVSTAMVRTIYPPNMLGRGLGLNTVFATVGATIAPPLGGLIMEYGSWHWVFAIGAPLALVGILCSGALPDPVPRESRYDRIGAVLCALTFGLTLFGLQGLVQGGSTLASAGSLAAGCMAGFAFIAYERSVTSPVLPVDLLAQPALALSIGSGLLAVLSSTLLMLFVPFHLSALGFGAAAIGAMITPVAIASMFVAPLSGMLSDKISPSVLGTFGMVIALASALAIVWLPAAPSYFDIAWRMALSGAGFSMFFSPNARLVIGSVHVRRAAGASSLLSTTRMFGQALGATMMGGLLASSSRLSPALVAVGLAVLALVGSALRIVVRGANSN